MPIMNNNEKTLEVSAAASTINETEDEFKQPAVKPAIDENMFFATGTFSIHHQPGDEDGVFIGE